MRTLSIAAWLCLVHAAAAQEDHARPLEEPETWELSGSALYSDPPGSPDRLTLILYADRGPTHLEARYNYEDLDTLSLFAGWNLAGEGAVEVAATPMLGVALGETAGIVPALELDLGWRRLAWYAEMEYLVGLDDRDDDFFYSWSTLTWAFTDWLGAGLVTERSKLVDTDFSHQLGLALQVSRGPVGVSLYAFNLGSDESYVTVALDLFP